jgi:hypothetical protein
MKTIQLTEDELSTLSATVSTALMMGDIPPGYVEEVRGIMHKLADAMVTQTDNN